MMLKSQKEELQRGVMDSGFNFASEIGAAVSTTLKIFLSFSGTEATNISLSLKHPEVLYGSYRLSFWARPASM
jgi:hypothetical protein